MSKYLIRIFSSFCDSENCKTTFERVCETQNMQNYGKDKEIYITTGNDYTHAIILNTAMPMITLPLKNIVGLACEPVQFLGLSPQFIQYATQNIGKYFIGDQIELPKPFIAYYSFMWHLAPLREIPIKTKIMSIMVSAKNYATGHKYRHQLVQQILRSDLPIDIHGNGCKYYSNLNDSRICGSFIDYEPYKSYDFNICIENFQTEWYMSEKIINSLICGTTPIYLGAKNAGDFFDNNLIRLSGDISTDMNLLTQILQNPEQYKKHYSIDEIKNKTNLLKNLDHIFS